MLLSSRLFLSLLLLLKGSLATDTCNDDPNEMMTNGTTLAGTQLGNITVDLPPYIAASTCCSVASSFATLRSENSTDGLPFAVVVVGPPEDPGHVGQFSYACVVYDYGAEVVQTPELAGNASTGTTPDLAPFPPPPTPCATFSSRDECIGGSILQRCWWWGEESQLCDEQPPIACGTNSATDQPAPLCFHVGVNGTSVEEKGPWTLLGTDETHVTVLDSPPTSFTLDAYFSVSDGQVLDPTPHLEPFKYCVEYGGSKSDKDILEVCMQLTGVYDASWGVGVGSGLAMDVAFINDPFVINYYVRENATNSIAATAGSSSSSSNNNDDGTAAATVAALAAANIKAKKTTTTTTTAVSPWILSLRLK